MLSFLSQNFWTQNPSESSKVSKDSDFKSYGQKNKIWVKIIQKEVFSKF